MITDKSLRAALAHSENQPHVNPMAGRWRHLRTAALVVWVGFAAVMIAKWMAS